MVSKPEKDQKVVVYTAIIGNYDQLKQPYPILNGYDYICFTDQFISDPGIWQIRKPPHLQVDDTRLNRFIKCMPHQLLPEYSRSVYIDGSIEIIGDPSLLIENALAQHSIAAFSHPFRNCFYEEARFCMMSGSDSWLSIFRQIKKYKQEGYPPHHGLVEAGILIRKHKNKEVIDLMEAWWIEIMQYSRRDQLSFNYTCWKQHTAYESLGISSIRSDNLFFKLHNHIKITSTSKRVNLFLLRLFFKFIFFIAKR